MDVYERLIMDVELLFMEMKDHWSNHSTDPEISSSPTAAMEEPDIVQELCQDAIKRKIKWIKEAEAKQRSAWQRLIKHNFILKDYLSLSDKVERIK